MNFVGPHTPFVRRMSHRAFQAALLAVVIALSGCASKPPAPTPDSVPPPAVSSSPPLSPGSGDVATVTAQPEDSMANLSAEERAARAALEREGMVIYFDYDSSQIRAEFLPLVASHARYAGRFRDVSIRLEGHTDERGSREYNIGLGERRAQAVRKALQLQGVTDAQVRTVSYGEERPAVTGSGEGTWSRNRRVEISYSR